MISIRKLAPLALALGMSFATTAQAAEETTFNLKNHLGQTIVAGANELDWSSAGSGVATGIGPFGTPLTVGQKFDFRYQATLVGVNGGVANDTLLQQLDGTANGQTSGAFSYEITIVAHFQEVVTYVSPDGRSAEFGLGGNNTINKVAVYYDTNRNANTKAGTGFDDGTQIALLSVTPDNTFSSFRVTGANTGNGGADMTAEIREEGVDFIDPAYFENVERLLFGMLFDSNLNYPAGPVSSTNNFHVGGDGRFGNYGVGPNDIVFNVDANSRFTQVPEPGSMVLLGAGLLGLAGAARRRATKKA